MTWKIEFTPEALKDFESLDGSQRKLVVKALNKVSLNPLPEQLGGYGKTLGNHSDTKLHGFLKIKLRSSGIRIVYQLIEVNGIMLIIVIGLRADNEVYDIADKRIKKNLIK